MRMDNETYRLKVENLFDLLVDKSGAWRPDVRSDLEHLALSPRKGRYFLRVVSTQPRDVQIHFYRFFMSKARREDAVQDLERYIRHLFYEAREEAKKLLAEAIAPGVLPALFRVIALTEEGWLAGELIRVVLSAPIEVVRGPVNEHLQSKEYLLQCLAIYLTGKLGDEELLEDLADFYRKPDGEKVDRLEKKAHDALLEGGRQAAPRLVIRWLKDKNARVREVGLTLAAERNILEAVSDLIGLVLIDPKTRGRAAVVALAYEQAGLISWDQNHAKASPVLKILSAAKEGPLIATLRSLLRDENPYVREVAVKLVCLAPRSDELTSQLRRLVTEDHAVAVQIAAMHSLAKVDREKMVLSFIELFSVDAPSREALDAANALMETLEAEEVSTIKQGLRARLDRRQAALDRFVASVEWWRHDT